MIEIPSLHIFYFNKSILCVILAFIIKAAMMDFFWVNFIIARHRIHEKQHLFILSAVSLLIEILKPILLWIMSFCNGIVLVFYGHCGHGHHFEQCHLSMHPTEWVFMCFCDLTKTLCYFSFLKNALGLLLWCVVVAFVTFCVRLFWLLALHVTVTVTCTSFKMKTWSKFCQDV